MLPICFRVRLVLNGLPVLVACWLAQGLLPEPAFATVGTGSCTGTDACEFYFGSFIGDLSCNGSYACYDGNGSVGNRSCNGAIDTCLALGGNVGNDSCNGDGQTCFIVRGNRGDGSCNGTSACKNNFGSVGPGSCNGGGACLSNAPVNPPSPGNLGQPIGSNSCNGPNACATVSAPVGDCEGNVAGYEPAACLTAALDHFTLYKVKTTKDTTKFVRFGPVLLGDQFGATSYDVTKPTQIGLPANKNGEGVNDDVTHVEEYAVKPVKGSPAFQGRSDVQVVNQCNDLLLVVGKPVSLLVPTAKSLTDPVTAPDPSGHGLDHFLCYKAKPQAKLADGTKLPTFPKGIQVDVSDQFQTRRYDLKKITKLCNPVGKSGDPVLLSGPDKGAPKPISAATIRHPDDHLVCYAATIAKKRIEQSGCGPADPADKGTTIEPAQAKHAKLTGLFVANQFGTERLDTIKETELCIPSTIESLPN